MRTCPRFALVDFGRNMKIVWERKDDEELSKSLRETERVLGRSAGKRFQKCLDDIRRERNWQSLIQTRPSGLHRLQHERRGQWAMTLGRGLRLIIKPDATNSVTIVVEIVDYH